MLNEQSNICKFSRRKLVKLLDTHARTNKLTWGYLAITYKPKI